MIHSGRGGAGNIRSPSRTRDVAHEAKEDALQARLVAEERGRQAEGNFSTGRGGAGNISRSKSRSRSAVRDVRESTPDATRRTEMRSGGRGGWGNIREERDSIDEVKVGYPPRTWLTYSVRSRESTTKRSERSTPRMAQTSRKSLSFDIR